MSKARKPGLTSRPPGPRNVDEFLEGAGEVARAAPKPRRERVPASAPRADQLPASRIPAREMPDFDAAPELQERFVLRMQRRHHAMLRWLSAQSGTGPRRRSMQAIALDLLEPAIEEAVIKARPNRLD